MAAIAACHSTAAANQIILAKSIVFMQMDSRAAAGFREKLRKAQTSVKAGFWSSDNRNLKSRFLAQVQA